MNNREMNPTFISVCTLLFRIIPHISAEWGGVHSYFLLYCCNSVRWAREQGIGPRVFSNRPGWNSSPQLSVRISNSHVATKSLYLPQVALLQIMKHETSQCLDSSPFISSFIAFIFLQDRNGFLDWTARTSDLFSLPNEFLFLKQRSIFCWVRFVATLHMTTIDHNW